MSLDVMRARVTFRDRSFLDVLDLALRFFVVHVWLYAKVALVVLVPSIALSFAAASLGGWWVGWLVAIFLGFAAQVPFTMLASRVVFEHDVRAREVLRAAARELPRVFVMRVLWVLAMVVGLCVLVFPACWLGAALVFTTEAMLLERAPIFQGLSRSNRLAMGALPDAIVAIIFVAIAPVVAVLLADIGGRQMLSELFQFKPPASMFSDGGSVLALIGWFGIIPYATTGRFFIYLNVRTRVEGWDVQTRFAALAMRNEADALGEQRAA